jgi:hypothetical protein
VEAGAQLHGFCGSPASTHSRLPGQPHYGGIVERIIDTAMQMIHDDLPGTTFSNPSQRGEYASE